MAAEAPGPGPLTLADIAARLGGRVAGDPGTVVRQVGSLERARADQIAFLANPKYKAKLAATAAGAVIVSAEAEALTALPRIVCDNPYAYFARVSQIFNPATLQDPGVHPGASVAQGVTLGARVSIGAGCVVGSGASIGEVGQGRRDEDPLQPHFHFFRGMNIFFHYLFSIPDAAFEADCSDGSLR